MCKISSLTLAATVWVFGIICGVAGADASPSVEDLTALLTKRDKELHSLAAVYREVFRGSRDGIVDGYLRRSVAFRSPCWFFRDNSHGHARLDWRQDPRRKTLLIRPGETTLLENLNRVLLDPAFTADGSAPFDVQGALLFRVLCWWPYTAWPPPEVFGRTWSMSSLLAGGDYRLRSETALLGDRHCVILEEPGIDALWLDAVPPHLVLRREVFNDQTGALAARYDFSGHSHHGGDVWLPRRFTNQLFDSYASSKESQERLVIDAKLEINQLRVNGEVVEEDFHLELPAGTVRSVVRDGIEHFDPLRTGQREHAKAMTKWAAALAGNRRQSSPSIPGYRRIAAWAALGLVVGLGVGLPSVFAREKRNVAPGEEACRRDELVRDTEQNIELLLSNNSIRRTGDQ